MGCHRLRLSKDESGQVNSAITSVLIGKNIDVFTSIVINFRNYCISQYTALPVGAASSRGKSLMPRHIAAGSRSHRNKQYSDLLTLGCLTNKIIPRRPKTEGVQ